MEKTMPQEQKIKLWDEGKLDTSERMALKAAAGMRMDEAPVRAVAAYYRARNAEEKTSRYKDEIRFACLCMNCGWDKDTAKKSFQELLASLCKDPAVGKTAKNRCLDMLDEPWRRDGCLLKKISSLAAMIRKHNGPSVMPDFERLAEDLCRWNSDSKYIQRNWIEKIFN